ncbi:hypothetical protein D3C79_559390 [compost metagenome]
MKAQPLGLAMAVTKPCSASPRGLVSCPADKSAGMAILPFACHIWMPSQTR